MYRVTADPEKRLIRFDISGYSDAAESERMYEAVKEAVGKLNMAGSGFNVLADLREAHVIPSENMERTTRFTQWLLNNGLRKSANVTTSTLIKMQLTRMTRDPRFGFFTSEEEALEWLEKS